MVTVITHGKKERDENILYKCTCGKCGCKFTFNKSDALSIETEKKLDGNTYIQIKCPECDYINNCAFWNNNGTIWSVEK